MGEGPSTNGEVTLHTCPAACVRLPLPFRGLPHWRTGTAGAQRCEGHKER